MTEELSARGTALVSGASRGLGLAIARALSRHGYDVAAGVRDPSSWAGCRSDGPGTLRPWPLNVTDLDGFVVPENLSLVVNNAAIRTEYQAIEATTPQMWSEVFATNVFGLLELVRRTIPALRANGGGVIVNVTTSALFRARPFFGTYLAGKAAVSAATQVLREEVAQFGIRVIEVMPGPVQTDMLATSTMYRSPDAVSDPWYRELAEDAFPARPDSARVSATPEQAAEAVVDAILDGASPARVAPDAIAARALSAWLAGPLIDTPLAQR